jgi:heme/copper-type cytochrome/quinol oxidase subunit 2
MIKLKYCLTIIFIFTFAVCFLCPAPGLAVQTGLKTTAGRAGLDFEAEPAEVVGGIIYTFYSIIGIILLIIMIYAGFLWMTAGGSEEQVKKAKDWIINAIIGLVIILSAYAVTAYVISRLTGEELPEQTQTEQES